MPDLILLELMMSGTDGLSVLRELKENDETENIPVIIMSSVDISSYTNEQNK